MVWCGWVWNSHRVQVLYQLDWARFANVEAGGYSEGLNITSL